MNQHEWLVCQDPAEMLQWLQLANIEWSTASNMARGRSRLVTNDKLQRWVEACRYFFYHHHLGKSWSGWESNDCMKSRIRDEEVGPVRAAMGWASEISQKQLRADLLRDIIGDPLQPVELLWRQNCRRDPFGIRCNIYTGLRQKSGKQPTCGGCGKQWVCDWLTPTVLSLAQAADDEGARSIIPPERLLVLADALEDAGCLSETECSVCKGGPGFLYCTFCNGTNKEINTLLSHLRRPGPHVRGCWAVELLRDQYQDIQ